MKSLFESRTFWFHVVTGLVGIAGVGLQYVGMLGLSPMWAMVTAMTFTAIVNVGGVILRKMTNTGIK